MITSAVLIQKAKLPNRQHQLIIYSRKVHSELKKYVYSGDSDGEVPIMGSIEDQMVLGMVWDNGKDVLKYTSKVKIKEPGKKGKKLIFNTLEQLESEAPTCLTRRQVLCQLNSVFDPLGLVARFVLKGKLLMRETWETENKIA